MPLTSKELAEDVIAALRLRWPEMARAIEEAHSVKASDSGDDAEIGALKGPAAPYVADWIRGRVTR